MGMGMFTMAWLGRPEWAGFVMARILGEGGRWTAMAAGERGRFIGGARRVRIPLLLALFVLCYAAGVVMTLVRLG
jgi:hypothetical protein